MKPIHKKSAREGLETREEDSIELVIQIYPLVMICNRFLQMMLGKLKIQWLYTRELHGEIKKMEEKMEIYNWTKWKQPDNMNRELQKKK